MAALQKAAEGNKKYAESSKRASRSVVPPGDSNGNLDEIMQKVDLRVNETESAFVVDEDRFTKNLQEFDPTSMPADAAVVILGKRRTGKSHTAMGMCDLLKDRYPTVVVSTGTKFNGFWQRIIPEEYVHEGFDEDLINKLMETQEARIQKKRLERAMLPIEQQKQAEDEDQSLNLLYILDDVASEAHLHSSHALGALYTKGRHYKISPWLLSQYIYAMSPAIRSNTDFAFILHQSQRRSKDAIGDEFLSQIPRRDAASVMSKFTPGYQMLVIDNSQNTDELTDVLSTYQAPKELPQFNMGDEEYWQSTQAGEPSEFAQQDQRRREAEEAIRRTAQMQLFPQVLQTSQDANQLLYKD
jgi:hypothetical protein